MFIGRKLDGAIYGCWSNRQPDDADHPGQEEVADTHPDVIAFLAPKPPASQVELEAACIAALNGGGQNIDLRKLIIAKAVSDEAYRLGKGPGALTGPELSALRARIAAIYKAL